MRLKRNSNSGIYLMLDIDGVLIPSEAKEKNEFDEKCVKILNYIISQTDCEICISSDWRNHFTLKVLGEIFEDYEIIKKPIDYTPDFWTPKSSIYDLEKIRTKEILTWISNNNPKKWCAIDDLPLELPPENFVWIKNGFKGLEFHRTKEKVIANLI